MKSLKSVFDFYINSSVHVALAVLSMTYVTLLELKIPIDWKLLCFIFFSSVTGYNFVKYFGIARFHHRSLAKWLKIIQIFSLFCFFGMLYYLMQLHWVTMAFLGIFAVITFFYAIPFLPDRYFLDKQKNLRNIGGLKVYVIALVWAGVTVLMPVLNNELPFDMDVWITALQRFLLVMMLMLPFEIRDLQYDSLKLATIPQKIGILKTKIIGTLMGVLFFVLEFFKMKINTKLVALTLIVAIMILLYLWFANKSRSDYYSSFWVESIPIQWLLLHLIF